MTIITTETTGATTTETIQKQNVAGVEIRLMGKENPWTMPTALHQMRLAKTVSAKDISLRSVKSLNRNKPCG